MGSQNIKSPQINPQGQKTAEQRLQENEKRLTELQARIQQLEAIFETMTDGIIVYDGEGKIVRTNAAVRKLFPLQLQPDYYRRSTIERITQYALTDEHGNLFKVEDWPIHRLLQGETLVGRTAVDIIMHLLDGRVVQLSISGAPVYDACGNVVGAVSLCCDVTERRRLERQTREILRQLQEANRQMDEMLSMTSHELRSPLTAIKGNIQLIERRLRVISQEDKQFATKNGKQLESLQKFLSSADQQVNRLNRLVDDLLDASRITSGKMEINIDSCNLVDVVQDAISEHLVVSPQRIIHLDMPANGYAPILADCERIAQVVTNYLTNAHKFSPSQCPIQVRIEVCETYAKVSVSDKGPGLAKEQQERIWERFQQITDNETENQRHSKSRGLGLGLYISRTIIEQHHGEVGVESEPGKGATFWFTLPLVHLLS